MLIKRRNKLRAKIVFSKKIAMRFHKRSYYDTFQEEVNNLDFKDKDKEKRRLGTQPQMITDEMIALYRKRGESKTKKFQY